MTQPLTDAINALTTYANTVTGASDTTLSDAVATLASGYGGGGGSVLPSGYAQLLYLQSSASQYIDTGLYTKTGQDYFIECTRASTSSTVNFMGNNLSTGCGMFFQAGNNGLSIYCRYGTANYIQKEKGNLHTAWSVKINASGMYEYNPTTKEYDLLVANGTTSVVENSAIHNILFGRTTGTTTRQLNNVIIFHFKCEENGVAVRDMYPAMRKSDGELGMYDTVNDVFYTNAGTGTFIAGIAVE